MNQTKTTNKLLVILVFLIGINMSDELFNIYSSITHELTGL